MFSPRDEFAKAAMAAILTRSPAAGPEGVAQAAYIIAEAMLAEQRRQNQMQIDKELRSKGWKRDA